MDVPRPVTAGMRAVFWIGGGFVVVAGFQLFVLSEHTDYTRKRGSTM